MLMKSNSSTFPFMVCVFGVESKDSLLLCLAIEPEIFSYFFSKKNKSKIYF